MATEFTEKRKVLQMLTSNCFSGHYSTFVCLKSRWTLSHICILLVLFIWNLYSFGTFLPVAGKIRVKLRFNTIIYLLNDKTKMVKFSWTNWFGNWTMNVQTRGQFNDNIIIIHFKLFNLHFSLYCTITFDNGQLLPLSFCW